MQLTRSAAVTRGVSVARPARAARVLSLLPKAAPKEDLYPKATPQDGSNSTAQPVEVTSTSKSFSNQQSALSDLVEGMGGPAPVSQVKEQSKDTKPISVDRLREESRPKPGFEEVMAFAGQAPEVTNGRLAMIGFTVAILAEIYTGETIVQQIQLRPFLILLTFIVWIGASVYPFMEGKKVQKVAEAGPLTPTAELINGRAAMIGFVAMIATEYFKGGPLLHSVFGQ